MTFFHKLSDGTIEFSNGGSYRFVHFDAAAVCLITIILVNKKSTLESIHNLIENTDFTQVT